MKSCLFVTGDHYCKELKSLDAAEFLFPRSWLLDKFYKIILEKGGSADLCKALTTAILGGQTEVFGACCFDFVLLNELKFLQLKKAFSLIVPCLNDFFKNINTLDTDFVFFSIFIEKIRYAFSGKLDEHEAYLEAYLKKIHSKKLILQQQIELVLQNNSDVDLWKDLETFILNCKTKG